MLRTIIGLWTLCICTLAAGTHAFAAHDAEPSAYDRLHDAIKRGDLAEVEWLAQRFPEAVNECPDQSRSMRHNPELTTALAKAIHTDDQTMVRLLVKYGAEVNPKREAVPDAVTALAEARLAARRTKNWVDADRLRTELHAAGWEMEDRPDGYALKRK